MKKNITINLCGRLYQIDEDAYELLSRYIDTLRNYFRKQEGGEEIANDIEDRIAELFDEQKVQGIEAITIENVQDIISRIGNVDDITDRGEDDGKEEPKRNEDTASENEAKVRKKFYRDPSNKIIAGVFSGCASYIGGTATIWRLKFIFLSLILVGCYNSLVFVPVLAYVLAAILLPEATTAEDVLKMRGKEVNPQNLGAEVTSSTAKNGAHEFWKAVTGVLSVCVSIPLAIACVVTLCFIVAAVLAPRQVFGDWVIKDEIGLDKTVSLIAMGGIMLMVVVGILLYCSIHSAASSFGKTKPMGYKQRTMWFVLWALSVASFVGIIVKFNDWMDDFAGRNLERSRAEEEAYNATHTHDGIVYSDEDWEFFREGGWKLTGVVNVDRYTYSGQYMTGDKDVRYLDTHSAYRPLIYTAEKTDSVEPGVYRLSAAVRSNNDNRYIYVKNEDYVILRACEVPVCGNKGGNIWEALTRPQQAAYMIVKERIAHLSDSDKRKIRNANNGEGYGWSYICVPDIKIFEPSVIRYGVSTDERFTDEIAPTQGWFSATDFVLERIGDI